MSVIDQADVNTLDKEHLGPDKNHKIARVRLETGSIQTPDRPNMSWVIYSKSELQYRDVDRCETAPFVPIHVSFDKKVLHFKGYYTEEIVEVPLKFPAFSLAKNLNKNAEFWLAKF